MSWVLIPLNQAGLAVGLMLAGLAIGRLMANPEMGWNLTALAILLFCLFNSVAGLFVPGILVYLAQSVALLAALTLAAILLSAALSGLSLSELGPGAMVFLAPVLYYPPLVAVMGLLRLFLPR